MIAALLEYCACPIPIYSSSMTNLPDLQALLDNITPDVYEALKRAVELGKWPNGVRLTAEQRETCLQAVIYYDGRFKPANERVGYIQPKEHEHCGSEGDEQLLVFRDMIVSNPVKH